MTYELNELMSFGRTVESDGVGNVFSVKIPEYLPEVVYVEDDDDGQILSDELVEPLPDGWKLLSGFTGQYSYNGPIMHPSEFIGGGLERYIRETAGLYVAVIVDVFPKNNVEESENAGWAVAYKEAS